MAMAASKIGSKLDVVVFGATGDTGRCCCHYLFNNAKRLNIASWAPAARNLSKLQKLVGDAITQQGDVPTDGVRSSTPICADSTDYASMLAMARSAKMIVACAGPFALYGENVIRACVEAGTDYVDITGETPWVNLMAKKYNESAKSKSISILSQSAYDSVPSDITIALCAAALKAQNETITFAETHHALKGGAMPTGTLKTLLKALRDARAKVLSTLISYQFAVTKSAEETQSRESLRGKAGLVPKMAAKASSRDLRWNMLWPRSPISGWTLPGFMAAVNMPIVHTTAQCLGYGDSLVYRERSGNNDVTALSGYGFVSVVGKLVGLTLLGAVIMPLLVPAFLLFPDRVSGAIENWLESDPGNAKAKAFARLLKGFRSNGETKVTAIAASESGKAFAEVEFVCAYDAGLGFTVLSALTVAAAVLEKRRRGEGGNGFETAVVAVGPHMLKEWYEKAGVVIQSQVRAKL